MLLNKINKFCVSTFFLAALAAHAKPEQKIAKATALLQEAMILLKEAQVMIDETTLLDPANFQKALVLLKEGKFEEARKIFAVFSKGNNEQAVQASYWIGLSFLEEKNYEKALAAFSMFLNSITNIECSNMTLNMKKFAYQHLVRCYEKTQRPADACAILKKMENEYNASDDTNLHEYITKTKARLQAS